MERKFHPVFPVNILLQAAEQGGLDFTEDKYPNSTYGMQNTRGWALNVDGTYAPADDVSTNVFYTYENQRSITAGNTYTANSNVSAINNGQPGVVGLSGNGCDGYTTLQQRNNNRNSPDAGGTPAVVRLRAH